MLGTLARHINYDMDEPLHGAEFHSRRSTKQLAIKHKLAGPMGEREASSKNDMRVTHLHAVVVRQHREIRSKDPAKRREASERYPAQLAPRDT